MEQYKGSEVDKYRCFMSGEGEKNTTWRLGVPPNFDVVNKLFEEGRTKAKSLKSYQLCRGMGRYDVDIPLPYTTVERLLPDPPNWKIWPTGSLEEQVQNLVKTWEMETFHKLKPEDLKTVDVTKLTLSVNGRKPLTPADVAKIGGGYNMFMQTSLPDNLRMYNPKDETVDTAHKLFTTTFPRGFAVEILQVYSGPPLIAYKFRHWGYMEGPFKGHPATGKLVEMFGVSTLQLDENFKIVKVEFFYDRGELLAGLMKGSAVTATGESITNMGTSSCPFS